MTPGVSRLLVMGSGSGDAGVDLAYVGIAVTLGVLLLCLGLFVTQRWAGLLFWAGAALGGLLGQAYALWDHVSPEAAPGGPGSWGEVDASWFGLLTSCAIGAVLGMLGGGLLADWWQARQAARAVQPSEAVEADVVGPHEPPAPTVAAGGHGLRANLCEEEVERYGVHHAGLEAEAV